MLFDLMIIWNSFVLMTSPLSVALVSALHASGRGQVKSGKCWYRGGALSFKPGFAVPICARPGALATMGLQSSRGVEAPFINMRDKIIGAIGIVWGGGMLLKWLMSGPPAGIGGYQGGQTAGALLGAVMLVAGLYRFFKRPD
ncbi:MULTISPECIES: hypothetical protein [unclassified Variovorax]|uniref:hypothetical protein n=1 Tax=unclassified Variovorax TaxID=663243 RepID=UPI0034E98C64